jgi:hypothetical protein
MSKRPRIKLLSEKIQLQIPKEFLFQMSENMLKIEQYFCDLFVVDSSRSQTQFNLSAFQLKTTNSNKRFHQLLTPSQKQNKNK